MLAGRIESHGSSMASSVGKRVVGRRCRSAVSVAVVVVAVVVAATGCGGGGAAPPAPEGDEVLAEGRTLWINNCANCHGAAGDGGIGPRLSGGRVLEEYPIVLDQVSVIRDGSGRMPSFGSKFDEAQLDAVVRYTREVLATG